MANSPLPDTRWGPHASWSRGGQRAKSQGSRWAGKGCGSSQAWAPVQLSRAFVSLCQVPEGNCWHCSHLAGFLCCEQLPTPLCDMVKSAAPERDSTSALVAQHLFLRLGPRRGKCLRDKSFRWEHPHPFWLRTCSKTDTHNFSEHYQPNDTVI